jgi:hypothetical protein
MEDEKQQEKKEQPKMVASALELADRLEKANKKAEETLREIQEAETYKALGGQTEGKVEEKKEELSDIEYSDKALMGTI